LQFSRKIYRPRTGDSLDLIFYDPPYQENYRVVLFEVGENASKLLNDEGILVVEHHAKNLLPEEIGEIRRWRILKQGETQLSFYEKS
jgi:16S rRNA G966 N2-methylase RsmD